MQGGLQQADDFGKWMKAARDSRGMSQTALSVAAGCSQTMISAWERSQGHPDPKTLERIERALNATFEAAGGRPVGEGFGYWLRRTRSERSMSVAELSRLSGVSTPSIYNIEAGRTPDPYADTRTRLEGVLLPPAGAGTSSALPPPDPATAAEPPAVPNHSGGRDFGPWLRDVREEKRMTQANLGKAVGVSQTMVSAWERSKARPDDEWIELLEQALGTRFSNGVDEPEATSEIGAFGQWLRRTRADRDMSVGELSSQSGVSLPAIYNIETGRTPNPEPSSTHPYSIGASARRNDPTVC